MSLLGQRPGVRTSTSEKINRKQVKRNVPFADVSVLPRRKTPAKASHSSASCSSAWIISLLSDSAELQPRSRSRRRGASWEIGKLQRCEGRTRWTAGSPGKVLLLSSSPRTEGPCPPSCPGCSRTPGDDLRPGATFLASLSSFPSFLTREGHLKRNEDDEHKRR